MTTISTPRAIGWIVRYVTGNGAVTIAWRRTRKEARVEQQRWPGAVLVRVTEYPGCG